MPVSNTNYPLYSNVHPINYHHKELIMPLFNLLIILIVAGIVMGLINRFIPMAPMIKSLLNLFVFVVLMIYVLQFFNVIRVILPVPVINSSLTNYTHS